MSRADAQLVVDLSQHSVNEAMRAMERVADSAPEGLYAHVAMLSALLLEKHLHDATGNAIEFLIQIAKESQANG